MRTIGAIRKEDRRAVSPVVATILLVAITIVLTVVLYVMVSGMIIGPGAASDAIGVTVSRSSDGQNWVLVFATAPAGKLNSTVMLTIRDPNGVTVLAATSLDALGGVDERYSPVTAGTTIAGGDMILLAVSVYAAGSTFQLTDSDGFLAQGTLQ